ncbi:MAG: TonB family protein [Bacteroidales bacterium]
MAKRDKYRKKRSSDFLDYSEGKMSDQDRNVFERRMQKDPFASDAAEGFSRISREEAEQDLQSAAGKIWKRIEGQSSRNSVGDKSSRNPENESRPRDNKVPIRNNESRTGRDREVGVGWRISRNRKSDLKRKAGRNRRIAWYSAAAAFASLMIVTTIFFRLNDNGLERFETAPEMQEAAKEQVAPSKGGGLEKEDGIEPAAEVENEVGIEPAAEVENEIGIEPAAEVESEIGIEPAAELEREKRMEQAVPIEEVEGEQEEPMQAIQKNHIQEGVAREESRMQETNEDHAFASKKMEEAAAGRYGATQQQKDASETAAKPKNAKSKTANNLQAPPEQILSGETPQQTIVVENALRDEDSLDEVVVIGYSTSKKSQLTASATAEEADPSGNVEYKAAVPENGVANFRSYIDSALVYPELSESSKKEVVVLKFSIDPDGQPQNFQVIRAPDNEAFENEAIRAVSEGPAWQPAIRNGQYIDEEVRLRIVFRID